MKSLFPICIAAPVPDASFLLFTLSALFAEPRIGKPRAPRLEEDARHGRNCSQVYSLLAGAAAITQPLSWLTLQP